MDWAQKKGETPVPSKVKEEEGTDLNFTLYITEHEEIDACSV